MENSSSRRDYVRSALRISRNSHRKVLVAILACHITGQFSMTLFFGVWSQSEGPHICSILTATGNHRLSQYIKRIGIVLGHTMMTSSTGNCVTGNLCGEFPVTGEFPAQMPVTRSFGVFLDLCLNKRLNKQQLWGWWFGTPSRPLWRHCNVLCSFIEWCPRWYKEYNV